MKTGYVYIITNKRNGTLYIEVTTNLIKRINQHKNPEIKGFASRFDLTRLVHYEICDDISGAISREKQLKKWRREWKIRLIEGNNPNWDDLYDSLV